MNFNIQLLLFCVFTSHCFAQEEDWTLKKSKDSINVYTKQPLNSDFKSIKATTTFNSPIAAIIKVITDADNHYKWINNCTQSKLLNAIGDTGIIFYEYYHLPWPASDRDIIIQTKIEYNAERTIFTLTSKGTPAYTKELDGVVRIPEFTGSWKLALQATGKVNGEYIANINPGGFIPAWLVNMFMVNGPYDSFINMKKMLGER
jgi:hypothetical protein